MVFEEQQRDLISVLHSEPCALLTLDLSNAEIKGRGQADSKTRTCIHESRTAFEKKTLKQMFVSGPGNAICYARASICPLRDMIVDC
eukprot:7376697-Prymnesium_polylepis.2